LEASVSGLEISVVAVHELRPDGTVEATFTEQSDGSPATEHRRIVIDSDEHPYGRALSAWRGEGNSMPMVPIEEQRAAARASIVAAIDNATAAILGAYPQAERLGWDNKASEAQLVLAAGEDATLELAPLLVAECVAEHGPADEVTRLAQLIVKAATVAAKATAWGELMAGLSGIRGRAFTTIAGASDAAAVQAALDAAVADIGAATMPP
jgi:hypothetical protein